MSRTKRFATRAALAVFLVAFVSSFFDASPLSPLARTTGGLRLFGAAFIALAMAAAAGAIGALAGVLLDFNERRQSATSLHEAVLPSTALTQGEPIPRPPVRLIPALVVAVLLVALGLGYFVWPTPWRYDQMTTGSGTFPVRTHRITDRAEILLGPRGWVHAGNEPQSDKPLRTLSEEEISKVQGTLAITNYGWLDLSLHNGTDRKIRELLVELILDAHGGQPIERREYRLPVYAGEPLTAFAVKAACGCQIAQGQGFSWRILSAKAE
jgi:hypothetical protein